MSATATSIKRGRTGSKSLNTKFGLSNTKATLSTALTGTHNDLVFTSTETGDAGANITVTYVDPAGNSQSLAVTTSVALYLGKICRKIRVSLATGGGGAITSTAAAIHAAIEAEANANALVTVANKAGNDGTGVVTAMAETKLA